MLLYLLIFVFISSFETINSSNNEYIIPLEYNISLSTDFKSFDHKTKGYFNGNTTILIQVNKNVTQLTINIAPNIKFKQIYMRNADNNEEIGIKSIKKHFNDNIFIKFHNELIKKQYYYISFINFKSYFYSNQNTGVLIRPYVNKTTFKYEKMMATQLQPESARKLFPCFDKPQFKTPFNMILETNSEYNILFNTKPQKCLIYKGKNLKNKIVNWKKCFYEKTPKMSTYNVALGLVLFGYLEIKDDYNRTFRVWARNEDIEQTRWTLKMTKKSLLTFENLMKLNFPLSKIDSLIIPNMRQFLGMEHYGLITYTEYRLMLNPKYPMYFSRVNAIELIAHEIAHQWFGNMITTASWTDIWLHEGFSNFYSYKIGYQLLTNDSDIQYLFKKIEILKHIRKMEDYFNLKITAITNDDFQRAIDQFGEMSYNKGHLVVDMIYNMIGWENLQNIMIDYLNSNKDGIVDTDLLWAHFKKLPIIKIDRIINGWLEKKGYPIVTVNISSNNTITVSQISSFDVSFAEKIEQPNWYIYLKIIYGNNTYQSDNIIKYLNKTSDIIDLEGFSSKNHWLIVNSDMCMYLTINYEDDNLKSIIKQFQINPNIISSINMAQLLIDSYDISKKLNKTNLKLILELMTFVKYKNDSLFLKVAVEYADKLNSLFLRRDYYLYWLKYIRSIFDLSLIKLIDDFNSNFTNKNSYPIYTRIDLYYFSCKINHKSCDNITNVIIKRWKIKQLIKTDYDLLHLALCRLIYNDNTGLIWNEILYDQSFDSWDFIKAKYYSLGCTRVSWASDKTAAIALISRRVAHVKLRRSYYRVKDYLHGITSVSRITMRSMILNNPNIIDSILRLGRYTLQRLYFMSVSLTSFPFVDSLLEHFVPTESHLLMLQKLYPKPSNESLRLYNVTMENINWIKINDDDVSKYLKKIVSKLIN